MGTKYPINDLPKDVIRDVVLAAQRKNALQVEAILAELLDVSVSDTSRHLDLETGGARIINTPEIIALRDRINYQIEHLQ